MRLKPLRNRTRLFEQLAHHAAAGELWTQAARYLRAAADRANERFAT